MSVTPSLPRRGRQPKGRTPLIPFIFSGFYAEKTSLGLNHLLISRLAIISEGICPCQEQVCMIQEVSAMSESFFQKKKKEKLNQCV
jgi:hypothetical protein